MKTNDNTVYNQTVRDSYMQILKQAKQMLATIEQEELRFTLVREDKSNKPGAIIHEIVNPLLYLRLECHSDNSFAIHWGFEQIPQQCQLSAITTRFIRMLYKSTGSDHTAINIESSVKTEWLIHNPSEMYEYVEERGCRQHTFKQLAYKPHSKRKLQAVA